MQALQHLNSSRGGRFWAVSLNHHMSKTQKRLVLLPALAMIQRCSPEVFNRGVLEPRTCRRVSPWHCEQIEGKGCLDRRLCSTADIFVPHLCLLARKSNCPPGEELCSY